MTEESYFVIQIPDAGRAQEFYGSLFKWSFEPGSVPDGYQIQGIAGGLLGGEGRAVARLYFGVEDIHAAVARVRELGGDCGDIGETLSGYQVDCRDDQGTEFSLHQQRSGE